MKISVGNLPEKKGFYFVKSKDSIQWQLLVEIIGVSPFLGITKIFPLVKDRDEEILNNILDLDWSEEFESETCEEIYQGFKINKETKDEIIKYLIEDKKLAAVKYLKESSRNFLDLKLSKEYCDQLYDKLVADGMIQP